MRQEKVRHKEEDLSPERRFVNSGNGYLEFQKSDLYRNKEVGSKKEIAVVHGLILLTGIPPAI